MHEVKFEIDGPWIHAAAVDDALYREAVRRVLGEVQLRPSLHAYDYVTDTGILYQIVADNEITVEPEPLQEIKSHFVDLLRGHVDEHGPFLEIPGASDLLASLRASSAHAVAIATGGWRESAELKLQSAGFDYSNVPLVTSNDHHERTSIMELALGQLGNRFDSVTYYGDGPWDQQACLELGWQFVAVGPELGGLMSYEGHFPNGYS